MTTTRRNEGLRPSNGKWYSEKIGHDCMVVRVWLAVGISVALLVVAGSAIAIALTPAP